MSSSKPTNQPRPKGNPNVTPGVEDPADQPSGVAEMGGQSVGSTRKDEKKKPR
jgi:hypothetical protein